MEGYTIHTLGQELEKETSREEALWTLGSRYGAAVVNKGRNNGITWFDNMVKVNPIRLEEIKQQIDKEKRNRGLQV
mgnify:CR=1 FL=1